MVGDFTHSASELEAALSLAPKDYDVAYTLGLAYLVTRLIVATPLAITVGLPREPLHWPGGRSAT